MRALDKDPALPAGVPRLGDKIRFLPAANKDHTAGFGGLLAKEATGVIVYINAARRWYQVEYQMGSDPGRVGYECFKF